MELLASDKLPHAALAFEFDRPVSGRGWWTPEGSRTWTAGRTASLQVRVLPGLDYIVSFRVLMGVTAEVLKTVTLTVNGQPVALDAARDEAGATVFRGRVPAAVASCADGRLRLALGVADVFSPKSLGVSDDPRPLGILLDRLRVEPLPLDGPA